MYVIMWSGAGVSSGELPLGCVMHCTVSQPLAVEKWVFVFVFVFPGVPPSEFVDDCLDRRQGRRAVVLTVAEFRDHVNLVYGDLLEKVKCSVTIHAVILGSRCDFEDLGPDDYPALLPNSVFHVAYCRRLHSGTRAHTGEKGFASKSQERTGKVR